MRTAITLAVLAAASAIYGQQPTAPAPDLASPVHGEQVQRMDLMQYHIAKAGNYRLAAIGALVAGSALTAYSASLDARKADPSYTATIGFGAMTVGLALGFDIASGIHLRKAGKVR